MLGAPIALFLFTSTTISKDVGLFVLVGVLALMVLGLHLLPLPAWGRATVAVAYFPLVAGMYFLAAVTIGCMMTGICL